MQQPQREVRAVHTASTVTVYQAYSPEIGLPAIREGRFPAAWKRDRMTKWEYATVPLLVHATKQILDTWGEDGWELVQVVPGPNNPEQLVAYLKREKQA